MTNSLTNKTTTDPFALEKEFLTELTALSYKYKLIIRLDLENFNNYIINETN